MGLKTRRLLFISFSIIFVVLTVGISLYATGYRLNLTWPLKFDQLLVKTGTLILSTDPNGARVELADKNSWSILEKYFAQKNNNINTPAKVRNLLPGQYEVNMTLDGYWPFTKDIWINPGESTYLEKVILLRNDLPVKIFDAKIQPITLLPDKNYLSLTADKTIIDLRTEATTTAPATSTVKTNYPDITLIKPADVKIITWINNNEFIYANDFEIYHFDINANSKYLITRVSDPLTAVIYWKTGYLIYATAKEIDVLDMKDNNVTPLLKLENMSAPILNGAGDTLYFTTKIGTREGLYKLAIR